MSKTFKEREREAYLSGTPFDPEVMQLIEAGERIPTSMGDIAAGFPDEYFLDEVFRELDDIINGPVRGVHSRLMGLRETLERVNQEMLVSSEYGRDELEKLRGQLGI